ncbi:MAG: hypothetical protein ACXIUP_02925 [Microcella sp.]
MITGTHTVVYSGGPDATREQLRSRGADIDEDAWTREYGRGLSIPVPGIARVMLYEPSYAPAWERPSS